MSNLLNAEFHRLIKNISFWTGTVFSVLWAVYNVMGEDFGNSPGIESFMFGNLFQILVLTGLTSALFIGEEYSCGAIRNKISTGHTRSCVYLTELSLCSGMMIFNTCICMLTALVCSVIRGYGFNTERLVLIKVFVCCLFTSLVAAAVIVLFSLNLHTKVSGLIAAALVMLMLTLMGNQLYQSLKQPEYRINYLFDENGQTIGEDSVYKNEYYIGDGKRIVTEMLYIFDPIAVSYYEGEMQYDDEIYCERSKIVDKPFTKIPICSLAECVVLTGVGLFVFKRKDLK